MTAGQHARLLDVKGLSVSARLAGGDVPVLNDITFGLGHGEILGVVGESGSGMSVLSRSLINWLPAPLVARSGEVVYKGRNILALSDSEARHLRGREISYVGADPAGALDPTVPVGQHLVDKLSAVEPGIARRDARRRVLEMFDAVRIPSPKARLNEFPFQFSGGMMQRVMIVDALIANPAFLIADNITQPLDVTVAKQIVRLLEDLRDSLSTGIIFVSSSLPMACEIASRLLVLQQGEIIEKTDPATIVDMPRESYTKQLVGRVPRIWQVEHSPPESRSRHTILSVQDVFKTYRTKDPEKLFGHQAVQAVRGVSFDILEGENFGIVGESGCGKSTLSRLLSWVEQPDKGDICFDGTPISQLSAGGLKQLRQQFQLILQDPYSSLPAHFTVGQIIGEPLRIHGAHSSREIRQRVEEVMAEVGLPQSALRDLPMGLSASQRQRVNIARAMVLKPRLLILDETLSALDQVEQARLLDLFDQLQAEHHFTYIFISHDLALVRRACSRIAVMYLGRVVELAGNQGIFFDPQHPYTTALLSAMPTIEEKRFDASEHLLDGEPPSPVHIPPGCCFRTRCPRSIERCAQDDPAPRRVGSRRIECHLYAETTTGTG